MIDALRLLALLKGKWNGHRPIDLDARRPEDVVEMDGGKRHRFDRIILFDRGLRIADCGLLLLTCGRVSPKAHCRNTDDEPFSTDFHIHSSEKCTVGCPTCGGLIIEAFSCNQVAWLRSLRRLDNLRYMAPRFSFFLDAATGMKAPQKIRHVGAEA